VAPGQVCGMASQAGGVTGRVGQGRRACGSAELVGQGVTPQQPEQASDHTLSDIVSLAH